ncbi:SRPBCC family protein [Cyclobacteriaceae bacterium]|jgi:carbon monoxide dehydrogenase subunit G|nr:SRPBCC family protein [Cyclobacteriaceae bacterium]MDC1331275.1 SRPBCC family protein [bacterium]MDB4291020.1 SRPBCC family protein [Cyclobacteriaceae bacterium]MDB4314854.1 SRPBCC family protein [Cyclobacteriaceae bacterium]MDB4603049.1 SRPBCC family protein [Cyclobacteriaceae bacterium]|tara:strand:- start:1758 stop:2279 length:522 start_codon:yes stop_codon:yes gene_type:complete
MEATITKKFSLEAPIEEVWKSLSNPKEISGCVPGATITDQIDDNNYKGEVTLKFGPIKTKYDGEITIEEMDNNAHTMLLRGKGLDSKGKGNAEMTMNGSAVTTDEGTEVDFKMVVNIQGTLAQFGSRLINDVSAQLMDQFVDNFKKLLSGDEVDNSLKAGSMMGSVVKGLFKK